MKIGVFVNCTWHIARKWPPKYDFIVLFISSLIEGLMTLENYYWQGSKLAMALGHNTPRNSASYNFLKFLSELLFCPWAKLNCAECMYSRYKVAVLNWLIGPRVQHTQAPFDLH